MTIALKDFVSESLKQIIAGVSDAQVYAGTVGAEINPYRLQIYKASSTENVLYSDSHPGMLLMRMVEFDVAVTAVESGQVKGGIGVLAGIVGLGTQGQVTAQDSTASRIRFSVPVFLPTQEKS